MSSVPPYLLPYFDTEQPPSPVLAPAPAQGGGFWSGLVDILKNVPISIGDARHGRTQLPSWNQMTSGKRLVDFGTAQGLDMGPYGTGLSLSPDEASIALQTAEKRQQTRPMGMDLAQQILPGQPGEGQDVVSTRAMLAQMPHASLPGLLQHIVSITGEMPGWATGGDLTEKLLGNYPSRDQAPITQSTYRPVAPASPAASAVSPLIDTTSAGELPTTAVKPLAAQPAPIVPRPQVAPLAAGAPPTVPTSQVAPMAPFGGLPMPMPPVLNTREITREDVAQDPAVMAAKTPKDIRKAFATAEGRIRTERHKSFQEAQRNYTQDRLAWAAQVAAMKPSWTGDKDVDIQLLMDNPELHTPGASPTDAQARAAVENLRQRKLQEKVQETQALEVAKVGAQAGIRQGQPLFDVLDRDADKLSQWRDPKTGDTMAPDTPYPVAVQTGRQLPKAQAQHLDDLLDVIPIVQQLNDAYQKVYGSGGAYERMTVQERSQLVNGTERIADQLMQKYPDVAALRALVAGSAEKLARAVGGIRGAGTEGDVQRTQGLFGELSAGLGIRWKGWVPMPEWQQPDTRAVAMRKLNQYNVLVDRIAGRMLKNPEFQHPGLMPRMDDAALQESDTRVAAPYRPTVGPEGMTKEQLAATPTRPIAPPKAKPPQGQQTEAVVLRQLGLSARPHPQHDPQGFATYMNATRQQLDRVYPNYTPTQIDTLTSEIAKRLGGSWQRPR